MTRTVLREIGADSVPSKLLLNKADRLDDAAKQDAPAPARRRRRDRPLRARPAATSPRCEQAIVAFFDGSMVEEELVVPYSRQALLGDIYENARVVGEDYDETGTRLTRARSAGGHRAAAASLRGMSEASVAPRLEPRATCAACRRPASVCYCRHVRPVQTATRVVLLQHPRERDVAIGTARMASLCLPNSELHVGVHWRGSAALARALSDPARPPALLYPGPGAIDVLRHPPSGPVTLVVIDGTWSQAKKVVRENPELAALPRYAFTPPLPSEYRIRQGAGAVLRVDSRGARARAGRAGGRPAALSRAPRAVPRHGRRAAGLRGAPSRRAIPPREAAQRRRRAPARIPREPARAARRRRVRLRRGQRVALRLGRARVGLHRRAGALGGAAHDDGGDVRPGPRAAPSALAVDGDARRVSPRAPSRRVAPRTSWRTAGAALLARRTWSARGDTTRRASSRASTASPGPNRGSTYARPRACTPAARWARSRTSWPGSARLRNRRPDQGGHTSGWRRSPQWRARSLPWAVRRERHASWLSYVRTRTAAASSATTMRGSVTGSEAEPIKK